MASTNKTTNYELSQFEGTDKPSWEADYNADMLAIDTNLKAVSDVADGASGSLSTLADRVTTAEGNITTNANDIDTLEARADALEAGQTSDDSRLDALEAEQIVQNTAIESNTRLGYNLARPYDSASTYAVGAYVLFQDTLYKCTTAIATGEAFDPTKWLAIKATDEIAAGGYTLPTASASTLGGVKVGSGLSIDGSGVLSASGGVTITELNSTNFDLTGATFNAAKVSGGTSTAITLNNTRLTLSSGYQQFLADLGNLNILNVCFGLLFDSYSLTSNDMINIICTVPMPNIIGSFSNMPETRTFYVGADSETALRFNLSSEYNRMTITAIYKNTTSTTKNVNGMSLMANLIYATNNT